MALYKIKISGTTPIIMHNGSTGIDTRDPRNIEKTELTRKKGSNRTATDEARIRELECSLALWLDSNEKPTIPTAAFRSCLETGARKLKQGPQVREGVVVVSADSFVYDVKEYGKTAAELAVKAQFTCGVVVQRNRILRTRAMFNVPWAATFTLDADPELVELSQLEAWLDIAGRRIGIGDWRPEKSGNCGRFTATVTTA